MRKVLTGEEAKAFYNTMTKGQTVFSQFNNRSALMNCGGYWKNDGSDLYTAYDFTDGTEVFIEEFSDVAEAIKYANGEEAKTYQGVTI